MGSIGALLFSLNILVAVQDIVLDGTAITMLSEQELGFGNSIQVIRCDKHYRIILFGSVVILINEFKYWYFANKFVKL